MDKYYSFELLLKKIQNKNDMCIICNPGPPGVILYGTFLLNKLVVFVINDPSIIYLYPILRLDLTPIISLSNL